MLQIRRYEPRDKGAIKALHYAGVAQMDPGADPADDTFRDADLDDIEEHYLDNNGDFLVGEEGDEIVVIGAVRKVTDTLGEIKRIRVSRDCQRRGYAKMILVELTERARALGYKELILDTLENNLGAQKMFEGCGFAENHRGMRGNYHLIFYTKQI